jgi:ABC-2 type transport system permease protein
MIWVLVKKELRTYFKSPLAYILAGIFSIITGWIFFNALAKYVASLQAVGPGGADQIKSATIMFTLFGSMNMLLIFICAMVTMRLFSEEKKQNTIEVLFSAPLSDWQILLGKFISSFLVVFFILSLTFIFPIIMYLSGMKDLSYVYSGYLGISMNILVYITVGILASSLTDNQLVAGILAIALSFFGFMVTWFANITPNYYLVEMFRYLGLTVHFDYVVHGILSTSTIVYYMSFIFFGLLMTKKSLESRNW